MTNLACYRIKFHEGPDLYVAAPDAESAKETAIEWMFQWEEGEIKTDDILAVIPFLPKVIVPDDEELEPQLRRNQGC